MRDVMIDIETMGTSPDAAIVAIGAVEMDLDAGTLGREFYRRVGLASAVRAGGTMDPETVLWWMRQGDEARAEIASEDAAHVSTVLLEFATWLQDGGARHRNEVRVWAKGAAFDPVILERAYVLAGGIAPWTYPNVRCYRTVAALHPDVPRVEPPVGHHALDDAKAQALHLIAMFGLGSP